MASRRRREYNGFMSSRPVRTPLQLTVNLLGPPAAILVAWLLSIGVDHNERGLTLANAALVMAVLTVAVALVDWLAGITTSVAAALALNYFHTEPIHTLRVTDARDVLSIMMLGLLGFAVSAATAFRVRRTVRTIRAGDALAVGEQLSSLLEHDQPADAVWAAATASPANDLGLALVRVVEAEPIGIPLIGRPTGAADDSTFELPQYGAAIRLDRRWLVLTPRNGLGPVTLDRAAVATFAATLELALDGSRPAVH